MDVANELVWKDAGLFDQVDSAGLRTAILNTSSKFSQQPPLSHTSHSSEHTFLIRPFGCLYLEILCPDLDNLLFGNFIGGIHLVI